MTLPVNIQSPGCGTEHGAKCTSVVKVRQQVLLSRQGLNLLTARKLQEFLHSESVFDILQILGGSGANISDMIVQAFKCDKLCMASFACGYPLLHVLQCKLSQCT